MIALSCVGCSASDHSASYHDQLSDLSVTIELRRAHPTLAEYYQTLLVSKAGAVILKQEFSQTTGYTGANLYQCSTGVYMLETYYETEIIDTTKNIASRGHCQDGGSYIGIFDGAGSKPWKFIPSSQQSEKKLEMSGG
jgi:hypothetical protein